MKVVVTGAAGHLGSVLVELLLRRDIDIIGVDTLLYGGEGLLSCFSHPRFRFVKRDVREDLAGALGDGVDAVVHLAALVGPVCEQDPQAAWQVNHAATTNVCQWARRTGAKVIFASTCSNYGVYDGLATEESPLSPLGVYAQTKTAAERSITGLLDDGVTLRFGTLAGLSPRPRFDTLLNQLACEACSQGRIVCRRPLARRPFLHIRDAAQAVLTLLAQWPRARHRCYNVVGFNTTIRELAEAIRAETGCAIEEEAAVVDGRDYAVSAALINNDLGFQPQFGLRECVTEICNGIRLGIVRPRQEHYNAI